MTLHREFTWNKIDKKDIYDIVSNGKKHYWFSIFLAFDTQVKEPYVVNILYDSPYNNNPVPENSSIADKFKCIKEYTHIILPDTDNFEYLTKLICDCMNKTVIEYNLLMGNNNEMTDEEYMIYQRLYNQYKDQ